MEWVVGKDFPQYAEPVLPWPERDPIRNTVAATQVLLRREGAVGVYTRIGLRPLGEWANCSLEY